MPGIGTRGRLPFLAVGLAAAGSLTSGCGRDARRGPEESLRVGLPVRFRPLVIGAETLIGFGPA